MTRAERRKERERRQIKAARYCQMLGGKPRRLKHYRCAKCEARRSLRRELWQYERPPRCRCGACDWNICLARTREHKARKGVYETCYCDGMDHYPHRRASSVWCREHPTGPTERDYVERYGNG